MHFTRHVDVRRRTTCRSSCAARAPTSTTPRASATSTGWPACSSARLGHGRTELAEAAAKQAERAGVLPAVVLRPPERHRAGRAGRRLRARRPQPGLLHHRRRRGRRDRLEAGQELLQAHRQADQAQGDQPRDRLPRHHPGRAVDHRPARHEGSRSSRWCPRRSGCRTPTSTAPPRRPTWAGRRGAFGRWAADQIAEAIENEGPDTVAAVFLEPVQNSGGCFPPPPGYFQRVREICDEYDVLLVSDEVICAFGRLGHMFGAERYGYQPDIITCAKGITSGYSPLGAMIATDRLMEPFLQGRHESFAHGYTFGGHPVSTAVAMANLDIFEREEHQRARAATTRAPSARRWRSSRTCRSSATSAATGTSTASSWSRTRPPRRPSTTTSPSGCCAASCPRRCSRPASTAAPTTAATRSSSSRRR